MQHRGRRPVSSNAGPTPAAADVAVCCTVSYSHPAARWLLGESFHPGGLDLTARLAGLMDIGPASRVLDVGSGLGASTVYLAKTLGCETVGITLESDGVAAGVDRAHREGLGKLASFVQGDIQEVDLDDRSFDAAVMECVLSIVPDKRRALRRVRDALKPGGRLGITDVTVDGRLPKELDGLAAVVACVGSALSLDGYAHLAADERLTVERVETLPDTAFSFLKDLETKLLVAQVAGGLGGLEVPRDLIDLAKGVLAAAQKAASEEVLGYGLLIVRRPPARSETPPTARERRLRRPISRDENDTAVDSAFCGRHRSGGHRGLW